MGQQKHRTPRGSRGERTPGGADAAGRQQGLRVRGWCDCGELGDDTTLETQGFEIPQFYFGGDEGGSGSDVTVTNVFLYDRPLSVGELKLVRKSDAKKGKGDGSMRGGVSRVLLLGLCGFSALYGA
ncbi:trans-sialidase [Trypanosoma cruzi]|nr:trans-sialidase [Trypanosoma cruzi]